MGLLTTGEVCCISWASRAIRIKIGTRGTKIYRMVNQVDSGTVKTPHSARLLEVWWLCFTDIFLCTKRFRTIRKRTARLNCAAWRFAAQQRSLGRIDGYCRRLKPVVPGVFSAMNCGLDRVSLQWPSERLFLGYRYALRAFWGSGGLALIAIHLSDWTGICAVRWIVEKK